jgi:hypothetical protein
MNDDFDTDRLLLQQSRLGVVADDSMTMTMAVLAKDVDKRMQILYGP